MPKEGNRILEGHVSKDNNARIIELFQASDVAAIRAGQSHQLKDVDLLYDIMEQIYISTVPLMMAEKEFKLVETAREKYDKFRNMVLSDPAYQTQKNYYMMFKIANEMKANIVLGLQKFQYFFRTATRQSKGLGKMHHYTPKLGDDDLED